jgi:hypothetical protein
MPTVFQRIRHARAEDARARAENELLLRDGVWDYSPGVPTPINERHLQLIVNEFVVYYNRGRRILHWDLGFRSRPSSSLRPAPTDTGDTDCYTAKSTRVLSGSHREYRRDKEVASHRTESLRTTGLEPHAHCRAC